MRRQHGRQAAHLAPAHGVRLTGQRKRPAARTPVFTAGQVYVDDSVAFIAAAGGLVDSHGIERDGARGGDKFAVEIGNLLAQQAAELRHFVEVPVLGDGQRPLRIVKIVADGAAGGNGVQQADKQPGASARCRSAISQVAVRRGSMTTTRI